MQEYFFVVGGTRDESLELYASVLANSPQEAVETLKSQIVELTSDDLGIPIPVADERITRLLVSIKKARISEEQIAEIDDEIGLQWDGEEINSRAAIVEDRTQGMKEANGSVSSVAERFVLSTKKRQDQWEPKESSNVRRLEFRVADKGGVSVYGLNRFPTTLYYEQWGKLLDVADDLRRFLEDNKSKLKLKQ